LKREVLGKRSCTNSSWSTTGDLEKAVLVAGSHTKETVNLISDRRVTGPS